MISTVMETLPEVWITSTIILLPTRKLKQNAENIVILSNELFLKYLLRTIQARIRKKCKENLQASQLVFQNWYK